MSTYKNIPHSENFHKDLSYSKGSSYKSKKTFTSKPLPWEWKQLTKYKGWGELALKEQRFLQLFYKKHYTHLSYKEIGKLFGGVCRKVPINFMKDLEERGLIKKKERFLTKHNGELSKIHLRNYYTFTTQGRKFYKKILTTLFQKEFKGSPLKGTLYKSKDMPREKLPLSGHFSSDERYPSDKKGEQSRAFNSKGTESNEEDVSRQSSEKASESYEDLLLRKCLIFHQGKVPPGACKLKVLVNSFRNHHLEKHLPNLQIEVLMRLLQENPRKVEKTLKFIRKKLFKKYRLRNFWAFFTWHLTKEETVQPWKNMVAQTYREAIDGKPSEEAQKVHTGIDSRAIVDHIRKLETLTQEIASEKTLKTLLRKGSHHLLLALHWVDFKAKAKAPHSWVGLTSWAMGRSAEEIKELYMKKETQNPIQTDDTQEGIADKNDAWLRETLVANKANLRFISHENQIDRATKKGMPYVLYKISQNEKAKSCIQIFKKIRGQWVEGIFALSRPDLQGVLESNGWFVAEEARG